MVPLPVALVFTGGTSLSPDKVTFIVCPFVAVSLFAVPSVRAVSPLLSVEEQPAKTRSAAPATASDGLNIRSRVFMGLPPLGSNMTRFGRSATMICYGCRIHYGSFPSSGFSEVADVQQPH